MRSLEAQAFLGLAAFTSHLLEASPHVQSVPTLRPPCWGKSKPHGEALREEMSHWGGGGERLRETEREEEEEREEGEEEEEEGKEQGE